MLRIAVELLMGRAVMSRWEDRESAEWPPHPDRVFMALVAAWGESGGDASERAALEWLEALGPPALCAPVAVSERSACTVYVPVNDDPSPSSKKGPYGAMGSIPIGRNRQPRMFPAVVPTSPVFYLAWSGVDDAAEHREALEALCSIVTYLGHSSTPVRAWVEAGDDYKLDMGGRDGVSRAITLEPRDDGATHRLRVPAPGRLAYLEGRHHAGLRPQPSRWQGYAPPEQPGRRITVEGPLDPGLFLFRQVGGGRLDLEQAGLVADALRRTLIKRSDPDIPEWVSGHEPNGDASRMRRPCYLPLAYVDNEHADGHLLGIALAVPRVFEQAEELWRLLVAHGDEDRAGLPYFKLRMGRGVTVELELDERPERQRQRALQAATWTQPAAVWQTVTPVVLPRYPRRGLTAEAVVARACINAGYPEPVGVAVSFAPVLRGVPHARRFTIKQSNGRPTRPYMHAEIAFPCLVQGPVILGAGRYSGFGFCRPLPPPKDHA